MWDGILNACAEGLHQLANLVGDWGLAIIIVTIVIRLILFPLQRKQFRSNFKMQEFQPRIKQIQEQYAGDQQKIQEETMKLYQETGFNPLSGCLPMVVQMPIFIILFQVLRWKLVNFEDVRFYNILPDLTYTVKDAISAVGVSPVPYIIALLLFIVFSISPMVLQLKNNTGNRNQSMIMLIVFGVMFGWMSFISPAGVLIYWALSSGWGFFQQVITQRKMKAEKVEDEKEKQVAEPVRVNVERQQRKKRPKKKH